jgi:hypothetical protein
MRQPNQTTPLRPAQLRHRRIGPDLSMTLHSPTALEPLSSAPSTRGSPQRRRRA